MNAIRKIVHREGNELRIVLPDDYKAEEFDVTAVPIEKYAKANQQTDEEWRQALREYYSRFNVDLSNFKFDRDELNER